MKTTLLKGILIVGIASLCLRLAAQVSIDRPILVKNINTTPVDETFGNFGGVGGRILFRQSVFNTGSELWMSDGTEIGTRLLKDIHLGGNDGHPGEVLRVNDTAFFAAEDGINGRELWKTDGTTAGTVLVKDITPGAEGSNPDSLVSYRGLLYFLVHSPRNFAGLWQSDGSESGTIQVKSFRSDIWLDDLLVANGTLFFTTFDRGNAHELWKSDGTKTGTVHVKTFSILNVSSTGTGPLYFDASADGRSGLWKTDGTDTGTILVRAFPPENLGGPRPLITSDGKLFFYANDGVHGWELWHSDGTPEGTVLLKDITPGPRHSSVSFPVVQIEGKVFFGVHEDGTRPSLWRSDGTEQGTVAIWHEDGQGWIDGLVYVNGALLFSVSNTLWKSDGTETKPIMIRTFQSNPVIYRTGNTNNPAIFSVFDSARGPELWKSDGTTEGTVRIYRPERFPDYGSFPAGLTEHRGALYFSADNSVNGREIWKTDGTEVGTVMVKDIFPGPSSSMASRAVPMLSFNGALYFVATDGTTGTELWRTDGTETGTARVLDLTPGADGTSLELVVGLNDFFIFVIYRPQSIELWKSDGTGAGTRLVTNLGEGYLAKFLNVDGIIFFGVNFNGRFSLWKSDGTTSGTVPLREFEFHEDRERWATMNGLLFFWGHAADKGLWKSDGTQAGTVLVKDLKPGSLPRDLLEVEGILFFVADGLQEGYPALWKSDGTGAGTIPLANFEHGYPSIIGRVGGNLIFGSPNPEKGDTLWRSDGTGPGTFPLIYSDTSSFYQRFDGGSALGAPVILGPDLYFQALNGPAHAAEIWHTDGTKAGTAILAGAPFVWISERRGGAGNLATSNGTLFWSGRNNLTGDELWKFRDLDTDYDGLPNWWEDRHFAGQAEPKADSDKDGMTNLYESRAGTDPKDAQSILSFQEIAFLAPGICRLTWQSQLNLNYTLLRSSILSTNPLDYVVIESHLPATPPTNSYLDRAAPLAGKQFYRLVVEE